MAAAVLDGDGMLLRHLVEIVDVECALVLHLGVVEEIALDPRARRCLPRLRAQLVDDAPDRHELDFVRVADDHFVEQHVAGRMVVAVDEAGHDGHLLRVDRLRVLADQPLDVAGLADRDESARRHSERLCCRHRVVDGVDLRVEDDEIGVLGLGGRCRDTDRVKPWNAGHGESGSSQTQEFPAAAANLRHHVLLHHRCAVVVRSQRENGGQPIRTGDGRLRASLAVTIASIRILLNPLLSNRATMRVPSRVGFVDAWQLR